MASDNHLAMSYFAFRFQLHSAEYMEKANTNIQSKPQGQETRLLHYVSDKVSWADGGNLRAILTFLSMCEIQPIEQGHIPHREKR